MAVDALVALTLLSLMIPVALASIRLSLNGDARASEIKSARAHLGYLLVAGRAEAAANGASGAAPRAPLVLRLERTPIQSNEAGVGLCEYRATAASRSSKRIYKIETTKFCDGVGA